MARVAMAKGLSARALVVGLMFVLTGVMLVSIPAPARAADYPGQDEIEAARAAAADAAAGVSQLDAAIAQLEDALHEADVAARLADVDYHEAQDDNIAAQRSLYAANQRAEEADAALASARTALAAVAMADYRNAGGFSELEAMVKADGFEDVVQRAESIDRASAKGDVTVQEVRAAEIVADTTRGYAEDAATDAAAAEQRANDTLVVAQDARSAAEQAVSDAATARSAAVARVAELRGVTAELEEERQSGLAAERAARQQAQFEEEQKRLEEAAKAEQDKNQSGGSGSSGGQQTGNQTGGSNSGGSNSGGSSGGSNSGGSNSGGSNGGGSTPEPEPTTPAPEPTTPEPEPEPTTPEPPTPEPEPEPDNSWRSSAAQGASAASYSQTLKGAPYAYGGNGPAYDCSGLTSASWRQAGISIPRSSRTQYQGVSLLPYSQLRKGDLVFWGSGKNASLIYHVAIYIGGGMVMEATTPGNTAKTRSMYNWAVGDMMPYIGRP
ncbi:NlpC/P60 family protein [Demequina sp. NBRC 110056]|uniref:C40 family peptidase n=1 Tax=Demequina sp. NBRC 110056 TaxID=1570345 RepID=UPI0011803140|nr:C40 family peptidase [Demequina sp. NBRC 110056]